MRFRRCCFAAVALCLGAFGVLPADPPPPKAISQMAFDAEVQCFQLLAAGRQREAESVVERAVGAEPTNQRLAFLKACLRRTRFDVRESAKQFLALIELDRDSTEAIAAELIVRLDSKRDVDNSFDILASIVEEHPGDPMLRWMIAVQCRSLRRNEEGEKHYRELAKIWKPGPSLMHQTFANILDDLKKYDESLVSRKITVELEPAPWSYQGLADTYTRAGRYEEAGKAYEQCVALAPDKYQYWRAWGWGLMRAKKNEEAEVKLKRALELNPKDGKSYGHLATIAERRKQKAEAIRLHKECLKYDPENEHSRDALIRLEGL